MKLNTLVYALPLLLSAYSASVTAQYTTARNSTLVSDDNTAQIDSLVRIFTGQTVEEQKKEKSDKLAADRLEREAEYSTAQTKINRKKGKRALKVRNEAVKQDQKDTGNKR